MNIVVASAVPLLGLITEPVSVAHYLVVGAILFVSGVVCMAMKRNALGVLMGIELVLNGANVNFVAFASPYLQGEGSRSLGLDGQVIALFVILLAAAEAAATPMATAPAAWPSVCSRSSRQGMRAAQGAVS